MLLSRVKTRHTGTMLYSTRARLVRCNGWIFRASISTGARSKLFTFSTTEHHAKWAFDSRTSGGSSTQASIKVVLRKQISHCEFVFTHPTTRTITTPTTTLTNPASCYTPTQGHKKPSGQRRRSIVHGSLQDEEEPTTLLIDNLAEWHSEDRRPRGSTKSSPTPTEAPVVRPVRRCRHRGRDRVLRPQPFRNMYPWITRSSGQHMIIGKAASTRWNLPCEASTNASLRIRPTTKRPTGHCSCTLLQCLLVLPNPLIQFWGSHEAIHPCRDRSRCNIRSCRDRRRNVIYFRGIETNNAGPSGSPSIWDVESNAPWSWSPLQLRSALDCDLERDAASPWTRKGYLVDFQCQEDGLPLPIGHDISKLQTRMCQRENGGSGWEIYKFNELLEEGCLICCHSMAGLINGIV